MSVVVPYFTYPCQPVKGGGVPKGLPLIGVRGRLFTGITMALRKAMYGDESGLAPGTGNHKGCPYNRFAGAYFQNNDDLGCGSSRYEIGVMPQGISEYHIIV